MTACRHIAASLACVGLVACTAPPMASLPTPEVPQHWSEPLDSHTSTLSSSTAWWKNFKDEELNSLIQRATAANPQVQLARARLLQSRASGEAVSSSFSPSVKAAASYAREKDSQNAPAPVLLAPDGRVESASEQAENRYQAGFDASWEWDLFGRHRHALDATRAETDASAYELGSAMLSLLAEVARNYIELRATQQQIALTQADIAAQRDMLGLLAARQRGGLASKLARLPAETQLIQLTSQLPVLENARRKSLHRLSVLLGLPPGALDDELQTIRPIPAGDVDVPVGLPSDLLRQRPDIRRAERKVAAATARVGLASADLYPRFSLTGSVGLASVSAGDFFRRDSLLWQVGPTLTWPILQRGQIISNIKVREAEAQAAMIVYRQAILNGLEETENAIGTLSRERERHALLARDMDMQRQAVDLVRARYAGGLIDFRDVLDAQRALSQRQSELARSDAAASIALVALYKALGGGWDGVLSQSGDIEFSQVAACRSGQTEERSACSKSR